MMNLSTGGDDPKRRPNVRSHPVACCLSDAELRKREATLLAQFKSALTATEELFDGYAFRIPGEKTWLALATDLIAAERECCPLLTFQLTAQPNMGALTLLARRVPRSS